MTPRASAARKNDYMLELRASSEDICEPYAEQFKSAQFFAGKKPWEQKADIYLTCSTQNELDGNDADRILANHPVCVAGVSNMGCTAGPWRSLSKLTNSSLQARLSTPAAWLHQDWR